MKYYMDLTGFPKLQDYVNDQKLAVKNAVVKGMKFFEIRCLSFEYPHVSMNKPTEGDLGINRRRTTFCFLNGRWKRWSL